MLKQQTSTKSSALFSIIGLESHCYYSNISVDFTPPFNLNKASNSIVPTFYRDGTYFTPAFILPREKEYFMENSIFQKQYFEQRVKKANSLLEQAKQSKQKKEVFSPIQPTVKYCQICKTNFECYSNHIKEMSHVTKREESKANQYIRDLYQRHEIRNIRKEMGGKRKLIRKENVEKSHNCKRINKTSSIKSLNQKTNNSINSLNGATYNI